MNNTCFDCDVVRDLMPLVIDDAASGTSRGIVETHLKECPACRGAMEEMRAELAERKATPEDYFVLYRAGDVLTPGEVIEIIE